MDAADCADVDLLDQITSGMAVVGDIASPHRWAADRKPHVDSSEVEEVRCRAFELGEKVLRAVRASPITEQSPKVWEATMEDVQEGAALGPFFDIEALDPHAAL